MKNKSLVGFKISQLDELEAEAKAVLLAAKDARDQMYKIAVKNFIENGGNEIQSLNEKLLGKLDLVFMRLKKPKGEIILGSLYTLNSSFGSDVNLAELLVSSGLFSKVHRYHSDKFINEDHKFESECEIGECIETSQDTGRKSYYDPVFGVEVTESAFKENLYYTLLPTTLYLKVYSELLELYNNTEIT